MPELFVIKDWNDTFTREELAKMSYDGGGVELENTYGVIVSIDDDRKYPQRLYAHPLSCVPTPKPTSVDKNQGDSEESSDAQSKV